MSFIDHYSIIEDIGHDKLDWLILHRPFQQGIPLDDTYNAYYSCYFTEAV